MRFRALLAACHAATAPSIPTGAGTGGSGAPERCGTAAAGVGALVGAEPRREAYGQG
jgi:hypothetical protein